MFTVRASSEDDDCNEDECAPDKEVSSILFYCDARRDDLTCFLIYGVLKMRVGIKFIIVRYVSYSLV